MTQEHLPPRAAGNKDPITVYIDDQDGAVAVLGEYYEGHSVRSLCRECNNGASDRGLPQAYARWREDTINHLREAAAAFHQVHELPHDDMWGAVKASGAFMLAMEHGTKLGSGSVAHLHPGRIARQILGMILAVQRDSYLLDNAPQLAKAYRSDDPTSIEPYSLHVALADPGGFGFFTDAVVSVTIDLTGENPPSVSQRFWAIVFPPFVMILAEGPNAPIQATRIDQWLNYPVRNGFFSDADRNTTYPIADQRELLVRWLYQNIGELSPDPLKALYE